MYQDDAPEQSDEISVKSALDNSEIPYPVHRLIFSTAIPY